jgi:hypothetical protein
MRIHGMRPRAALIRLGPRDALQGAVVALTQTFSPPRNRFAATGERKSSPSLSSPQHAKSPTCLTPELGLNDLPTARVIAGFSGPTTEIAPVIRFAYEANQFLCYSLLPIEPVTVRVVDCADLKSYLASWRLSADREANGRRSKVIAGRFCDAETALRISPQFRVEPDGKSMML